MKATVNEPTLLHKPQIQGKLRLKENSRHLRNSLGFKPTKILDQRTLVIDRSINEEAVKS